jgi:hypothetical protein
VLPANIADVGSMVSLAMTAIKQQSGPASGPTSAAGSGPVSALRTGPPPPVPPGR